MGDNSVAPSADETQQSIGKKATFGESASVLTSSETGDIKAKSKKQATFVEDDGIGDGRKEAKKATSKPAKDRVSSVAGLWRKTALKMDCTQGLCSLREVNETEVRCCQEKMRQKFKKYYNEGDNHIKHHDHGHADKKLLKKKTGEHGDLEEEELEAPLLGFVSGIPEDMQQFYELAHDLDAVQKLSHGHHQDLTVEDVNELYDSLKPDDDGRLQLEKIHVLLTHCLEPPCAEDEVDALLASYPTVGGLKHNWETYFLNDVTELYNIFTRGPDVRTFFELRRQHHQAISRSDFQEHVEEVVERNDYFLTLPLTAVHLFFFILFLIGHLRIYDRSVQESSMEEFVNGRDPRETCDENVDDMDSLWEWLQGTGLRGPFGNVKNSTYNSSYKHCILAARNVLIGDVQLKQRKIDGTENTKWFLNSETGAKYLASHPGDFLASAQAAGTSLQKDGGDHPDIVENWLMYNTYNEKSRIFSLVKVFVPISVFGDVKSKINVDAVCIEPYFYKSLYVVDGIFTALSLWMAFSETHAACSSLRLGCGEFMDYWEFWNVVDWIQILLRVLLASAWVMVYFGMMDPNLRDLVDEDSGRLKVDVMLLSQSKLEKIHLAVAGLRMAYAVMQLICALNTMVLVAKFFKSFNSNPRLRLVQDTFKAMAIDFSHFLIIFTTIFLPFALIGFILFGSDLPEFSSLSASVNTGVMLMMGEFGWYADIPVQKINSRFGSGKLMILVVAWYFIYVAMVVQVLLNMCLAIILEKYLDIANQMHMQVDAPPIWVQIRRYKEFKNETKGFIPLETLKLQLGNDDEPAHPSEVVCAKSLLEAFPSMSQHQAIFLICWLEEKKKKEDHDHEEDDEALEALEEEAAEKIQQLFDVLFGVTKEPKEETEATPEDNNAAPVNHIMAPSKPELAPSAEKGPLESTREHLVGQILEQLQEAQTGMAKLMRDQGRLVSRIDKISAVMPSRRGGVADFYKQTGDRIKRDAEPRTQSREERPERTTEKSKSDPRDREPERTTEKSRSDPRDRDRRDKEIRSTSRESKERSRRD